MRRYASLAIGVALVAAVAPGEAAPAAPEPALPNGMKVLASARARPDGAHRFAIVAVAFKGESRNAARDRPLLVYRLQAGRWTLVARNDHVVLRADDGGQCDPFEFGRIVAKGPYFTVENGVGCGITHFSDLVTFRFDPASRRYAFDNWRTESLAPNPSRNPDAEALVSTGVKVTRARRPAIPLERWRRPSE